MAMMIYTKNGTFSPSAYGLGTGDTINFVLVGGGQSGGVVNTGGGCVDGSASTFAGRSSASGVQMGRGGPETTSAAGTGAGGYLPGVPIFGGSGCAADAVTAVAGLAGSPTTASAFASPYCNPYGDGNCGATAGDQQNTATPAAAGNGYGAGGAGASNTFSNTAKGGDAGKIYIGSIALASAASLPVVVGVGGSPVSNQTAISGCGAPGVVVVTW